MLRISLLFAIVGLFAQLASAQVRATTASGNKVLLFDDGTWKYDETKASATTPAKEVQKVVVAPVLMANVEIDASREIIQPFTEFLYMPSKRLARYFGEEKGKVRCKLSCENVKGVVKINYMWEMTVGDGPRYFGYLKEGTTLDFHLQNGETVQLLVGADSKINAREQYNFTAISGSTQELHKDQLAALMASPVRKLVVDWKKRPETYELDFSPFFIENLPKVL